MNEGLGQRRTWLSFRAVNRRDRPGYNPGLQRHHILPMQLLRQPGTMSLFRALGRDRLPFDDFRRNGLLLPANDQSALQIGLPLHRGPHHGYNQLVSERVGQIEAAWANARRSAPEVALVDALADWNCCSAPCAAGCWISAGGCCSIAATRWGAGSTFRA